MRKVIVRPNSTSAAFTLIDLLGIMAALALFLVLLLPSHAGIKQEDRSAVCLNNLRQIGSAMWMLSADNDDTLFTQGGSIPNQGQWFSNPSSTNMLAPSNSSAYWGVAYFPYAGRSREIFRCPSARMVDEWRDAGLAYPSEFWLFSTYGVCQYLVRNYQVGGTVPKKLRSFARPATTILVQDSAEQRMEGADDSLGKFPGSSQILTQWKADAIAALYGSYPFVWEWYRHDQKCNTLWLSGGATKISFNGLTEGIDYRYYTGDEPGSPLP